MLARCRPGEGVAGLAEEAAESRRLGAGEAASNPAEVVRGRRGDGGGDWRGDSRGVTAPGAVKHRTRGLGAGDACVIDGRLAFEPGLTET